MTKAKLQDPLQPNSVSQSVSLLFSGPTRATSVTHIFTHATSPLSLSTDRTTTGLEALTVTLLEEGSLVFAMALRSVAPDDSSHSVGRRMRDIDIAATQEVREISIRDAARPTTGDGGCALH